PAQGEFHPDAGRHTRRRRFRLSACQPTAEMELDPLRAPHDHRPDSAARPSYRHGTLSADGDRGGGRIDDSRGRRVLLPAGRAGATRRDTAAAGAAERAGKVAVTPPIAMGGLE